MSANPQDPYEALLSDLAPPDSDPFDLLDSEFQKTYGKPLRFTGRDTKTHIRLHGVGQARDIGVRELSGDELKFVLKRGPELGLNLRDFSKAKPHTTSTGVKITGPHIHGERAKSGKSYKSTISDSLDPYAAILNEPEAAQDDPYAAIFAESSQQSVQKPLEASQSLASPTIAPTAPRAATPAQASRAVPRTPVLNTDNVQAQASQAIEQMINEPDTPNTPARTGATQPPITPRVTADAGRSGVEINLTEYLRAGKAPAPEDIGRMSYQGLGFTDDEAADFAKATLKKTDVSPGDVAGVFYQPADAGSSKVLLDRAKGDIAGRVILPDLDPYASASKRKWLEQYREEKQKQYQEKEWGEYLESLKAIRPEYRKEEAKEIARTRELTPEERQILLGERGGIDGQGLATLAEGASSVVGNALTYAGELLASVPKIPGLTSEGSRELGRDISGAGSELTTRAEVTGRTAGMEEGIPRDVVRGAGSSIPFLALGGAGTVGRVGAGVLGWFTNAGQIYEEALASGADHRTALTAAHVGGPAGLLEMWGIGGTLDRLGRRVLIGTFIRTTLREAGEEATQEAVQQALNNLTAKGFYDPSRGVFKDVGYSALVAGITGGLIGGGAHAVTRTAEKVKEVTEKPQPASRVNLLEAEPGVPIQRERVERPSGEGQGGADIQRAAEAGAEASRPAQREAKEVTPTAEIKKEAAPDEEGTAGTETQAPTKSEAPTKAAEQADILTTPELSKAEAYKQRLRDERTVRDKQLRDLGYEPSEVTSTQARRIIADEQKRFAAAEVEAEEMAVAARAEIAKAPVKEGRVVAEEPARVPGVAGVVKRARESERRAQDVAGKDSLTGLRNQGEWKAAQPRIDADPKLHVARLDIDGLKAVNDQHSHLAGDKYIAQVGKIIAEEATKAGISDRLQFRSGTGDEFTLAGPKEVVQVAANSIRQRIASEVELPSGAKGSISAGIAPTEKRADAMMYVAKRAAAKASARREEGLTPEGAGISNEELARTGTFYKVSKSGALTFMGKQADATLKPGEATVYRKADGTLETYAGDPSIVGKYGARVTDAARKNVQAKETPSEVREGKTEARGQAQPKAATVAGKVQAKGAVASFNEALATRLNEKRQSKAEQVKQRIREERGAAKLFQREKQTDTPESKRQLAKRAKILDVSPVDLQEVRLDQRSLGLLLDGADADIMGQVKGADELSPETYQTSVRPIIVDSSDNIIDGYHRAEGLRAWAERNGQDIDELDIQVVEIPEKIADQYYDSHMSDERLTAFVEQAIGNPNILFQSDTPQRFEDINLPEDIKRPLLEIAQSFLAEGNTDYAKLVSNFETLLGGDLEYVIDSLGAIVAHAENLERLRTAPSDKIDLAPGEATEKAVATGKTSRAVTPRGIEVKTRFALFESDQPITSHDIELRPNAHFPEGVQNRDRAKVSSEDDLNEKIKRFEPEYLGRSIEAGRGAPIMGPDMAVESGNGRVIMLRRIYRDHPVDARKYRTWLEENAARFGMTRAQVEAMNQPILAQVRLTALSPAERIQFAEQANEDTQLKLSPVEVARGDARKLSASLIAQFKPGADGDMLAASNREFVKGFLDQVVGPSRGDLLTSSGELNQHGVDRVRNAIFARAYADTDAGIQALEKLAEETDVNTKRVITAMVAVAPRFVELKQMITGGGRYNLDLSPDLAEAARQLSLVRESGVTVDEFLRQGQLFGENLTRVQKKLLWTLNENARSATKLGQVLTNYLDTVDAIGDPRQQSFFSENVPTKEEILEAAVRRISDADQSNIGSDTQKAIGGAREGLFAERPAATTGEETAPASSRKSAAAPKKEATQPAEPVVPTDRSSFKKALIEQWGTDPEVARHTASVAEGLATQYVRDLKATDPKTDTVKAKRDFFGSIRIAPAGEPGSRSLEQSARLTKKWSIDSTETEDIYDVYNAQGKIIFSGKERDADRYIEEGWRPPKPVKAAAAKPVRENPAALKAFEKAEKHFGTTGDIAEAGYILPDGTMLDFTGRHQVGVRQRASWLNHQRSVDHREIQDVVSKSGFHAMVQFIGYGAVRIHRGSNGTLFLSFIKPLTESQMAILSRNAESGAIVSVWDKNGEDVYSQTSTPDRISAMRAIRAANAVANGEAAPQLFQGELASTEFTQTGEAIIRAGQNPDASSAIHEVKHAVNPILFRLAAQPNAPASLKEAVRVMETESMGLNEGEFLPLHEQWVNGTINAGDRARYVKAQESDARKFEGYVREGNAPTSALKAAFAKFKEWLSEIYQRVRPDMEMSDNVRRAFDRILGGEREAAAAKVKEDDHWNFKRSTFASPEVEARFRDVIRTAVAQGGDAHKTKVTFQEHLARVEALSPDLVPEIKRLRDMQIVSREIFTKAARYAQTLTNQAQQLRSQITPATMPDEALALEDRIAVLEHDAAEIAEGLTGARSEFGRNLSFMAVQKTDQMSPENVLAIGRAKAEARGLDKNSRTWRTAAQKLFGSANEVQSAEKEKRRIAKERKAVQEGSAKKAAKREPWQSVMLGNLKAQAKEASARLQQIYGQKLYQEGSLTAEELDQVRAKFESLKKSAAGRPIKTVVDDYVRQGGLFGAELSPAQQGALMELASPTRRAPLSVEQSSLFDTSPTVESRREQSQIDKAGPSNLLFQRNEQVDTPEFKRWFGESKVVDANGEPLVVYHGTNVDFDVFKAPDESIGMWFSTSTDTASRYSRIKGRWTEGGDNVTPVFLSIQNPAPYDLMDEMAQKGKRGKAARDILIERGYDGVAVDGGDSYVAFQPAQIKSAIGNRGTFDPSNPNILFQREENIPALAHDIATILAARVAEESQSKKGLPLDRILEEMRGAFPDVIGQFEEQIKATADGLLKDARRQALVSAARDPETQVSARRQLALDVADSKKLERQTQEAANQKRRQVDRIWEREAEKAGKEALAAYDRSTQEWYKVQEEQVAGQMLAEVQREQGFKQAEQRRQTEQQIVDEKLSAEEATKRLADIDAAQTRERLQIDADLKTDIAAQKQFEKDQRAAVLEEARKVSRAALEAEHARLQDLADEARSQMKADRQAAREAQKDMGADARARRKAEREQAARERRWDYPIIQAANEARERIAQAGYTPTVEDIASIAAAMRLEEGRTSSPYQELVSTFGDFYRQNAVAIRNQAAAMLSDARSGATQRRLETKAAGRAEGKTKPNEQAQAREDYAQWQAEELSRLAAEEAWQDKRIRNGKRDIAREFAKLNIVPWWEKATDVWGLFRSQMASIDLLHLRQGSPMLLNHPTVWAKSLWSTAHTWTEAQMDERTNELETHPGADLARMSGLRQAAVEQRRSPLSILARQEEFQNRLVRAKATLFGKSFSIFPHLVVSERQYTTGGDTLRMGLFWLQAEPLLGKYPPSLNPEVYATIAHVSNIVTGVGDPGRFAKEVAFLTRYVGFAPNWLLSRFQLLGMLRAPFSYRGQPIEVRRIAAREAYGYAIRMSALFALAHLLGITSFDIDDDDFLKLRIPGTNQKWDITAGGGGLIKTLLKLLRSSYRKASGQPEFVGDSFGDTVKNFARSKLAPVPSFLWDKYEGTTFTGEPFTWTEAIASRTLPMIVNDQYDNMKVDGARGLIALPFQILGGNVSSYRSRKMPDRTQSEAERRATGMLRERDFGTETPEEANRRRLVAELVSARKASRPTERILAELEKGTPLQRLIPSVAGKPGGPLTEKEKENIEERMTVAPLERAYKYLDEAQKLQVRDVATPAELAKIEPTAEAMKQRLTLLFQSDEYKAAPTPERTEMMKRVAQVTREGKNEAETELNIQRDTVHDKLVERIKSAPQYQSLTEDDRKRFMQSFGQRFARTFAVPKDTAERLRAAQAEQKARLLETFVKPGPDGRSALERDVDRALEKVATKKAA